MPVVRAVAAVLLASLIGACGDESPDVVSDGGAVTDQATSTIQLGFRGSPDEAAADEAVEVIRRRLDGLGIEDATVERDASGITVRYPESATPDPGTVGDLLTDHGELSFRPVLASTPPEVPPGCDVDSETAQDPASLPEVDPGGAAIVCHQLGPEALSGSSVESARAVADHPGPWMVALELREGDAGLDPFNALAAACFARAPECPTGQLAVVFDGAVVSAPTINAPSFEENGVSIVGDFTEKDAEELALVLRSGALPVELEVVSEGDG